MTPLIKGLVIGGLSLAGAIASYFGWGALKKRAFKKKCGIAYVAGGREGLVRYLSTSKWADNLDHAHQLAHIYLSEVQPTVIAQPSVQAAA